MRFRDLGAMFGLALDRAVTASVLNWKILALFFLAFSADRAIGNLWLRYGLDFVLLVPWSVTAAAIGLRSLGKKVELSARNVGRFTLTWLAVNIILAPLVLLVVGVWSVAAPLAIRFQQPWTSMVVLAAIVAAVAPISRIALAPLVSMIGGLSTRESFREAIALTRGRYVFTAISVCLGYLCAVLPSYVMYDVALQLFNVIELHLDGVPFVDQVWIAGIIARPFGLYAAIASCVIWGQLIDWLTLDAVPAKTEGLV